LLQSDDHVEEDGGRKSSPLAKYAAQHWVTHAQFERVSSFIRKAMEYLFDSDKPYFAAWVKLHDIDTRPEEPFDTYSVSWTSGVIPVYYTALCGFQDLVEHLVIKYPQHVNTSGGKYGTPLVAALAGRHFQTARYLLHNGAHVNIRDSDGITLLHSAAWYGDLETVRILLDYKAEANTQSSKQYGPIHVVPLGAQFLDKPHHSAQTLADIARLLLEHGADVHARTDDGLTPLHLAARWGRVEVVRVLLEHGANVGAEDNRGATPLHEGSVMHARNCVTNHEKAEVVRMLLEHGTNIGAKDNGGRTPLHDAAESRRVEVVRVLLEHGANTGAEDKQGRTPASAEGDDEIMRLLSEHGAKGVL
jgi:ankyrin repeat protein